MSRLATILLCAVAFGAIAFLAIFEPLTQSTREDLEAARKGLVLHLDPSKVRAIRISTGVNKLEIKRVGNSWQLGAKSKDRADSALIDRLQRGAFSYIVDHTDAETGLVADTSRPGSPCSIAVVGFALSSYPVAVKNGWMSRTAAAAQTLKTLQTFWTSTQSDQPDATGYKGFYYHFLHMQTRRRVWQCELSLVDTTLLLAGVLVAGCYFDGGGE